MKTIITAITILSLLTLTPSAKAINEEWSAVAGFVGGLLFSAAVSSDSHVTTSTHVTRHYEYHHSPRPIRCAPQPHGYWKYTNEKRWIPGTWYYEYDDCGRQVKYWREGYWDHYQRKVWVSYNRYQYQH